MQPTSDLKALLHRRVPNRVKRAVMATACRCGGVFNLYKTMPTILETPQSLCRRARQATDDNRDVSLDPGVVRQIAESWHADREKIEYLESLIVRVGKEPAHRNGDVPTPAIPWTSPNVWPSGPVIPNIGEQRCAQCGIALSPVMGYACGRPNCPTGLGGFSCGVTSVTVSNRPNPADGAPKPAGHNPVA